MELSVSASTPPPPRSAPQLAVVRSAAEGHSEIQLPILERARAGEPAALEAFVRHYQKRVFAFLYRSTGGSSHAEDLAQEVFLRAIRALPRFKTGGAKVSTWLFQIAVHLVLDGRKKKSNQMILVTDELHDGAPTPEESYEKRALLKQLEDAVAVLPEEQRVALVLFQFHALSHDEIGEITGAPPATVKTRIFRARQALKKALFTERRAAP